MAPDVPPFAWLTFLPSSREADPQLYDDLLGIWESALVRVSSAEPGALVATAEEHFARIARQQLAQTTSPSSRAAFPTEPACGPQLLAQLHAQKKLWLLERDVRPEVEGEDSPWLEPSVRLAREADGGSRLQVRTRRRRAMVPQLLAAVRRARWSTPWSTREDAAGQLSFAKTEKLTLIEALQRRGEQVAHRMRQERERHARILYIVDEVAERFCGASIEEALAIVLWLRRQGLGYLCPVVVEDGCYLGFKFGKEALRDGDRLWLTLAVVQRRLEARAAAWQQVAAASEQAVRQMLPRQAHRQERAAPDIAAASAGVMTRSMTAQRRRLRQLLLQKRQAEGRALRIRDAGQNIEQLAAAVQQAQDDRMVVDALRAGNVCAQALQRRVGGVAAMTAALDDLAEVLQDSREVAQVLTDDAMLNAEDIAGELDEEGDLGDAGVYDTEEEAGVSDAAHVQSAPRARDRSNVSSGRGRAPILRRSLERTEHAQPPSSSRSADDELDALEATLHRVLLTEQ
ncbi:hypothetical protein CDCA_CDCA04G1290 [Cyanidium caldarium]|uniref:Uncharacterized protein n=1 Tax=Cyanidium caldarium TaxID=2771 RepID=A0AAV9ISI9_CYACA|nr:hypothetical protein CDCA_CDCA04G1290 [Cyanidium caldarium]